MTFEEFQKKIGDGISPDKAFKLYLQAKLALIEEILINSSELTREKWDQIEEKVFAKIVEELRK